MNPRIVLIFLLLISCTTEQKITESNLVYFPPNASAFIKINDSNAFASELKNNGFLQTLKKTSLFAPIRTKIEALTIESIGKNAIMGLYPMGRSNHEFILLQNSDSLGIALENSIEKRIETLTYENREIIKYDLDGSEFFSAIFDNKSLLSSSQLLLENAIRTNGKNPVSKTLEKLMETADPSKPASIFLDLKTNTLLEAELKNQIGIQLFADWISVDFTATPDELGLSGVAIASDSIGKFINLFKGTTPLSDRTATIAPQNAGAVLSFSFSDYDKLKINQKHFLDVTSIGYDSINNIEEVGIVFLNDQKAIAVHAFDSEALMRYLERFKTKSLTYQNREIWQLQDPKFIDGLFQPLVKNFQSNFYTVFEDTHVFAAEQGTLQTIIANKQSGYTFDKGEIYQSIKSQMGSESSMLFASGFKGLNHFLGAHFKPSLADEFKKAGMNDLGLAVQFTADNDFSHFNVLFTKISKTPSNKAVTPVYNLELNSDLVTDPQFVKNHRNHSYEIVVQDRDNYLYLISTEGKVLWKKPLEGRIRGKIHQVDLYKNGKLQLAFCTNNRFLILDRNGKEVPPFNKKFEGGNLNPLAVFDYENNRNYRFVVTQGQKVSMYNGQGTIVDGFTYTEAESPIISAPKHFRVGKKDYLVFQLENGQLKIRHRAGGDRIKVNRTISFSNNEVFLYKNKFSVTDEKGVLHQVDLQGKLSATNFNLSKDHGMYATSKTLALMDDNILNIKGKKVDLEFGVYTPPKIFYINDKIYVTVTDIQNQKIYLFDSQAKPIPNFPVYGTSIIDLLDMDNDNKLELVAKDQENSIIVYAIN